MKKNTLTLITFVVLIFGMILILTASPAFAESAQTPLATIDLTIIINAIIALIGAFLTVKVTPYFKQKLSESQFAQLEAVVKVAVYAAEEIYKSGHGNEKLLYVQEYLSGKGYEVDIEQIKAAVLQMRNSNEEMIFVEEVSRTETSEGDETTA